MRNIAVTGKEKLELQNVPEPVARGRFAKIRIRVIPMCTEIAYYRNGEACSKLGHEAAGEIVAAGESCAAKVGQRVVVMPTWGACGTCERCKAGDYMRCLDPFDALDCCGSPTGTATYAEFCLAQDWLLLPVPDDVSDEHASMAGCGLGPTFRAMQLLQVGAGDTVLVAGLGAVGLGAVINATHRGARVIGLERHPFRAELARKLGAEVVLDPTAPGVLEQIRDLTEGLGAAKTVETSNAPASPPFLVEATRKGGEIAFVSWSGQAEVGKIVGRGLTLHGAWHWNHLRDAGKMFDVIRANRSKLDLQITHRFPLDQVEEAWKVQMTGECGKILLSPGAGIS